MFAVILTGGKQYRVKKGDKLKVERLKIEKGGKVIFDHVLLRGDGKKTEIGKPYIGGVKVEGKLIEEKKDKKKIVFKFHSKTRYKKKKGHRQIMSLVEIIKV